MYTACMFCSKQLGTNAVIESFPVGRRLAFDAAKGRLWVVCRACQRWNLTLLETRWEAVEACERKFRSTRMRVSTDNIGLARLVEGLDLIRIGKPQRPEFAAWRYGDQFGRRRRRAILIGGGAALATGTFVAGAAAIGVGVLGLGVLYDTVPKVFNAARARKVKTDAGVIKLEGEDVTLAKFAVRPDDTLQVRVIHKDRVLVFNGDEGLRVAQRLVPAINSAGGSKVAVQDAVLELERSRYGDAFIARTLRSVNHQVRGGLKPLSQLPVSTRLAIEMALADDAERRAFEGELAVLEAAWREAEEIAAIADDMFTPSAIENKLGQIKSDAINLARVEKPVPSEHPARPPQSR